MYVRVKRHVNSVHAGCSGYVRAVSENLANVTRITPDCLGYSMLFYLDELVPITEEEYRQVLVQYELTH